MKVYLATRGEYSDYSVVRVFANREDAESYGLSDDVEEMEVTEGPIEVRKWHRLYWDPDPSPEGPRTDRQANPWENEELREFDGRSRRAQHRWSSGGRRPVLTVEGWSRNHVLKVYSEQRAQYLAKQDMGVVE